MKTKILITGLAAALLMGGCAITPDSITHKSSAEKAEPPPVPQARNGAIFQTGAYNPIFENRRARMVGDNLIIAITENTTAGKQGAGSASGSGSVSLPVPTLFNSRFPQFNTSANASAEFANKNAATSSNTFNGTIAVTVIEVKPNGNLLVSGEKQVALDKGAEFIRFSGIVNPKDISPGNIVPSTVVADARVEYRTNTRLDAADVVSKLARFFLSVIPF